MNRRFSFGILASVIALMGAMVFSACGHDDIYSESNVERMTNATYAAAFEKAFGKVGPNVDWGFSTKSKIRTRAVGDYASAKGAIAATVTFPTDCDAGNFLKDVPEGVNKLPADGAGPGSYYIDGTTTKVSTWAGASKIYVKGNVDLSADDTDATAPKFAPDFRSEIYLLEGATLKLGEQSALNFNVAAICIASGAKLETAGLLKANNSTKVYNHGIVSAGTFEVNTSSFLYNVGTLTAGSVNAESNDSRIVNDGTVNATDVVVNAGAVQNNAEWTVSATTRIHSNNSGWVNNGHWTTRNYAYIGGSENVINNCFLEVTNDFEMNISSVTGAFKMDAGCGVVTKNFYGGRDSSTGAISGPFKIVMGQASVFKVTETAVLESGRSSIGDTYEYGIFGPTTGGYAVFQAKNIVREALIANTWGAVTYGGNLYVSAETHFAQGNDGMAAHKFIFEQDGFSVDTNIYAAGFKPGKPTIKIKETAWSASVPRQVIKNGFLFKVVEISPYAFRDCRRLETVVIHRAVKRIGRYAFKNTQQLRTIKILAKFLRKGFVKNAFAGAGSGGGSYTGSNLVVKVPKERLEYYNTLFKKEGALNKKSYFEEGLTFIQRLP